MKENIFEKIKRKKTEKTEEQEVKLTGEIPEMFLGLKNEGAKEEIKIYEKKKLGIDSSNKPNLSEQEGDYGDDERIANEEE